jgi:uncharacterized protein YodC (DUF2158 family)
MGTGGQRALRDGIPALCDKALAPNALIAFKGAPSEARMNFKVGDVVQLKSGGPPMTVQEIINLPGEPFVRCSWFITVKGNQKLNVESFHPDSLIKAGGAGAIGVQF